jgi:hypothetical protein
LIYQTTKELFLEIEAGMNTAEKKKIQESTNQTLYHLSYHFYGNDRDYGSIPLAYRDNRDSKRATGLFGDRRSVFLVEGAVFYTHLLNFPAERTSRYHREKEILAYSDIIVWMRVSWNRLCHTVIPFIYGLLYNHHLCYRIKHVDHPD